jgi:hypothetical protein
MNIAYLDPCYDNTEYLNLMFRNELRECNEYTSLQGHLTVIFHTVPITELDEIPNPNALEGSGLTRMWSHEGQQIQSS